jgi:hypothetical protein
MSSNTVQGGSGLHSQPPVPLEKPPHVLELERKKALLARVKTLRESNFRQKGAILEGNPSKEYMWVNTKEDRRVSFEAEGWVLCKDPAVKTRWLQADGTHKRADLILYEIDKELFEGLMAYNQIKGIERVEGVDEMFLDAVGPLGVPTYKPGGSR